MKALITGASSGIGMECAKYLASKKIELILVARDKERLEAIQNLLPTKTTIVVLDLSNEQKVKELCVLIKNESIDIVINNAGFGMHGDFVSSDVNKELEMINVNVKAVHLITKYVLKTMMAKNSGYILNVASSAGLMPGGPLMSTYYATKSYVTSLTRSINYELKKQKSKVVVSCLCPGPVNTNFSNTAGVEFGVSALGAGYVARYAIDQMLLKKKMVIIPGTKMKLAKFFSRFLSDKALLRMVYRIQKKKKRK